MQKKNVGFFVSSTLNPSLFTLTNADVLCTKESSIHHKVFENKKYSGWPKQIVLWIHQQPTSFPHQATELSALLAGEAAAEVAKLSKDQVSLGSPFFNHKYPLFKGFI